MKNTVARAAVARDRKFADPVAPNRLDEAPPPKPEPMSAPLPCCSSTRPMIASATSTCATMMMLVSKGIDPSSSSLANRQKIRGDERRASDQAAVHVRHPEDRRRVLRLDAAAVQD